MPDAKIYSFEKAQKARNKRMAMRGERQQFHPSSANIVDQAKEFLTALGIHDDTWDDEKE